MNLVTTVNELPANHESDLAQSLYGLIAQRGLVGSKRLQAITGKSQATIARALASLGPQVIQLGKARRTLYAVPKPILGSSGEQVLTTVDEAGTAHAWGRLCYLEGQRIYVESALNDGVNKQWSMVTEGALPWFLEPLRLQGFLGKLRGAAMGFADNNPEHWSLEQVLFAVLAHEHDNLGAFGLGSASVASTAAIAAETFAPTDLAARGAYYDSLSQDVAKMVSKGSSAGGEQPKFLATVAASDAASNRGLESLIVKFTPPRGTPFGERWHDLLHAEAMALYVLSQHGIGVAQPRMIQTDRRTYLESVRFDRVAVRALRFGKRHVVSLTSVHAEFVGNARWHWPATCAALFAQGRLSKTDLTAVQTIHAFGDLIGNTDMHFGNLSLWVDDLTRLDNPTFTLAPVYDMLPMRYRPSEFRDEMGYTGFTPPDLVGLEPEAKDQAVAMAQAFWLAMSRHAPVSADFRRLAAGQVDRCVQN